MLEDSGPYESASKESFPDRILSPWLPKVASGNIPSLNGSWLTHLLEKKYSGSCLRCVTFISTAAKRALRASYAEVLLESVRVLFFLISLRNSSNHWLFTCCVHHSWNEIPRKESKIGFFWLPENVTKSEAQNKGYKKACATTLSKENLRSVLTNYWAHLIQGSVFLSNQSDPPKASRSNAFRLNDMGRNQ